MTEVTLVEGFYAVNKKVEYFAQRIRDELSRLNLSLAAAARDANESSPQRLKDVVSGKQRCPIDLLESLGKIQVDVQYVVTGIRSAVMQYVAPNQTTRLSVSDAAEAAEGYARLSAREAAVIAKFRAASEVGCVAVEAVLVAVSVAPDDGPSNKSAPASVSIDGDVGAQVSGGTNKFSVDMRKIKK